MSGIVYLVGAGPGDPGLLTMRGAELMRRAEVLVYDYLAAEEIMSLAPPDCRRIYVGKMAGNHAKTQDEINRILIEEAAAGRKVVRLKGGDPYIFGRGGEEAQELFAAGVAFEEVPGISSTIAAAAYAGIPLTHRDFSSQALLMTGHEKPEKVESAHDWAALAKMGTLSMVMGVKNLEHISKRLIENGKPPDTPAAMIQWGTSSRQRTLVSTLAELPRRAAEEGFGAPSLLVIGEVVTLREKLNWFERRPLFGKKILVTRSRKQISRLSSALAELGAEVWERPTIDVSPLSGDENFRMAITGVSSFNWLLFTSPNGADFFLTEFFKSGRDARALAGVRIGVVGPGTAEALKPFGLKADLIPEKYVAESFLAALLKSGVAGQKILLARAAKARDVLPEGLAAAGADLTVLPVYENVRPDWAEPLPGVPDLVTFTSSSTADGLAAFIPEDKRGAYPAASIGPVTSRTARALGFPIVAEAEASTIDGLVEAILGRLK